MKMIEQCFACGHTRIINGPEDIKPTTHDCPGNKLEPIELMVLGAMNMAEGCDHFCCGLSENTCRARTIARYLQEQGVLGEAPEWFVNMLEEYRAKLPPTNESTPS